MPEVRYWNDDRARQELMEKGRGVLAQLQEDLAGRDGVIAIEPESGSYWIGATLGKANNAAYTRYPDHWVYFCRLDDPSAEMALPTW